MAIFLITKRKMRQCSHIVVFTWARYSFLFKDIYIISHYYSYYKIHLYLHWAESLL